jgi:sugar O-acyltransferase (sialic acid O-acetyltransferase NeuD family)
VKPLVIFGVGDLALLAHRHFTQEAGREVAAFTLDRGWIEAPRLLDKAVVPFEELRASHPPARFDLFVALGYARGNTLRRDKYLAARAAGYTLPSHVSPHAIVVNDGRIGDNVLVMEGGVVQPYAEIGANVTLWSGAQVAHHSRLADHVFVAPGATIAGHVNVAERCFIGANATLRDHVTVAAGCVIGAGAVVVADTEPGGVYAGNPARRVRDHDPSERP